MHQRHPRQHRLLRLVCTVRALLRGLLFWKRSKGVTAEVLAVEIEAAEIVGTGHGRSGGAKSDAPQVRSELNGVSGANPSEGVGELKAARLGVAIAAFPDRVKASAVAEIERRESAAVADVLQVQTDQAER